MSPVAKLGSGERGYWGVGIYHPKTVVNVGTLWRSASAFGAAFLFTVGQRYHRQPSDTVKADRHIPLLEFETLEALSRGLPLGCPLVGVELTETAESLETFRHPERAAYLLGAEDYGLLPRQLELCHHVVRIPFGNACLNVAVAGSIVMYDRVRARTEILARGAA